MTGPTDRDEPKTTAEIVLDKLEAQLAELEALRGEYEALTPDERAAMPESVRRFFGE